MKSDIKTFVIEYDVIDKRSWGDFKTIKSGKRFSIWIKNN